MYVLKFVLIVDTDVYTFVILLLVQQCDKVHRKAKNSRHQGNGLY